MSLFRTQTFIFVVKVFIYGIVVLQQTAKVLATNHAACEMTFSPRNNDTLLYTWMFLLMINMYV